MYFCPGDARCARRRRFLAALEQAAKRALIAKELVIEYEIVVEVEVTSDASAADVLLAAVKEDVLIFGGLG